MIKDPLKCCERRKTFFSDTIEITFLQNLTAGLLVELLWPLGVYQRALREVVEEYFFSSRPSTQTALTAGASTYETARTAKS